MKLWKTADPDKLMKYLAGAPGSPERECVS